MDKHRFQGDLDTSGLCSFCRQIDFHKLLGLGPHHLHYRNMDSRNDIGKTFDPLHNSRVLDLERLRHAPHLVSYCDFCRFLEVLRPLNQRGQKKDTLKPRATIAKFKKAKAYSLYAFCPWEVYHLPNAVPHCRLLAVLPTNVGRALQEEFGRPESLTYILPVVKGAREFSGRLIYERFNMIVARRWL